MNLNTSLSGLLPVPLSEKIMFAKHLSMMIRAGMPVVESLKAIRKQFEGGRLAEILDTLIKDMENGQFLSVSLEQFERVFGKLFISVIKIGEKSGTLAENLDYLAVELKKSQQLRSKTISAMIYPIIITVATLGISGGIVFFVLPKILPIFSSLKVTLPLTTQILIAVAKFLVAYYLWLILGLAVLVVVIVFLLRLSKIRYGFHRLLISLPFVRKIVVGSNTTTITRTLGLLLKSGVKIVEAIYITSDILQNLVYKKELLEAAKIVEKGGPLHKYLEEKPVLFPSTVSRMIDVGENTGNLIPNLFYLADFYESEVDEFVKNLSDILEPALLIVMGLLVGFVAISIITPLYSITQGFQFR